MNLIMMGTGDFAVPTFRRLLDQGNRVSLLVTQPDRPQGRHLELTPAPIKRLAMERGVPVFQPESVNTPESIARLAELSPDLFVVAAYGQILSDSLLEVPHRGGVNLHASLLPKYRGAAPINWAIYHGETVTGVSVIQMTPRIDAGAILLQAETTIDPRETAGELEIRLAELGAPLVCEAINGIVSGTLHGRKQDRSLATRAPKLRKEDGLIDWSRPAKAICDQIRAMQPWPMPFTFWHRADGASPMRIIIERAEPLVRCLPPGPGSPSLGAISVVAEAEAGSSAGLCVMTQENTSVLIHSLRPAGKRSMTATEFLRGQTFQPGDRFGPES